MKRKRAAVIIAMAAITTFSIISAISANNFRKESNQTALKNAELQSQLEDCTANYDQLKEEYEIAQMEIADLETEMDTRTMTGTIITSTSETMETEVITEDGNIWVVTNFVTTETECNLTFDTNGTEDVTDDTIISIDIIITK